VEIETQLSTELNGVWCAIDTDSSLTYSIQTAPPQSHHTHLCSSVAAAGGRTLQLTQALLTCLLLAHMLLLALMLLLAFMFLIALMLLQVYISHTPLLLRRCCR